MTTSRTLTITLQMTDGASVTLRAEVPSTVTGDALGDIVRHTMVAAGMQFQVFDALHTAAHPVQPDQPAN